MDASGTELASKIAGFMIEHRVQRVSFDREGKHDLEYPKQSAPPILRPQEAGQAFQTFSGTNMKETQFAGDDFGNPTVSLEVMYIAKPERLWCTLTDKSGTLFMRDSAPIPFPVPELDPSTLPSYPTILDGIERLAKPAWLIHESQGDDGSRCQWGGAPWLPAGEPWPVNKQGTSLVFVCQVDPSELPDDAGQLFGSDDLVAVFFDPEAEYTLGKAYQDQRFKILRFATDGLTKREQPEPECSPLFMRFERVIDYPVSDDPGIVGQGRLTRRVYEAIEFLEDEGFTIYGADDSREAPGSDGNVRAIKSTASFLGHDLPDDKAREVATYDCRLSSKVGGWPHWMQEPVWPRSGGRVMNMIMQVNRDMPIGDFHGYAGIGHFFIDPANPNKIVFAWAK